MRRVSSMVRGASSRRGMDASDDRRSQRFALRPSIARMTLDLADAEDILNETKRSKAGRELLQHRLADLLVFEIMQDGSSRYKNLSVRKLYKYVLKAISVGRPVDDENAIAGPSGKDASSDTDDDSPAVVFPAPNIDNFTDEELSDDEQDQGLANISERIDDNSDENDDQNDSQHNNNDNNLQSSFATKQKSGGDEVEKSVTFGGVATELIPTKSEDLPRRGHRRQRSVIMMVHPDKLGDEIHAKQHEGAGPVTYRERLGGYLHPRDMRRLVTPFSASNEPEVIVRRHVVLLNFDPLRAVILRDRLLILVPDGADSLLVDLERRVRGGYNEFEKVVFGESSSQYSGAAGDSIHSTGSRKSNASVTNNSQTSSQKYKVPGSKIFESVVQKLHHSSSLAGVSDTTAVEPSDTSKSDTLPETTSDMREWEELEERGWLDLPFELQCVDAVLGAVSNILSDDTQELRAKSVHFMDSLLTQGSGSGDEILRHMKSCIREMTSRVKGFLRALNLVLDETQDMALMNLSRLLSHPERFIQPVPEEILNEESDEPELILEAHLQLGFSLINSLDLIEGEIESTQELINQRLDAVRNKLLMANMIISVGSFCVGIGSFIGSIFGMNVKNFIEDDGSAFYAIIIGTCVGIVGLAFMCFVVLWCSGTLPNLRSGAF